MPGFIWRTNNVACTEFLKIRGWLKPSPVTCLNIIAWSSHVSKEMKHESRLIIWSSWRWKLKPQESHMCRDSYQVHVSVQPVFLWTRRISKCFIDPSNIKYKPNNPIHKIRYYNTGDNLCNGQVLAIQAIKCTHSWTVVLLSVWLLVRSSARHGLYNPTLYEIG